MKRNHCSWVLLLALAACARARCADFLFKDPHGGRLSELRQQVQQQQQVLRQAPLPTKSDSDSYNNNYTSSNVVSFCPERCTCNITLANQLQVTCQEYFDHDFPVASLRKDVEILKIVPRYF